MKGNFGIAGQLAVQDALLKTQAALFDALVPGAAPRAQSGEAMNVEAKLVQLKQLLDRKAIDQGEYARKREEILRSL
jgi:predicted molibdopterin-dependent oxidoreductase YjgC